MDSTIYVKVGGVIVTESIANAPMEIEVPADAFLAFNDEFGGLRNVYRNRIYGTHPCSSSNALAVCGSTLISAPAQEAAKVKQNRFGLEAALAKGPWKLQAEFTYADLTATSRAANGNPLAATTYNTRSSGNVSVGYVELMYNITGENWAPTYRSGVVGSIRPNVPFDLSTMSGTGAWQVGVRYSQFNASSFASAAGKYKSDGTTGVDSASTTAGTASYEVEGSPTGNTLTLGVNWLLNPNARIMFNYSRSQFGQAFKPVDIGTTAATTTAGDTSQAFMIRSQFNF